MPDPLKPGLYEQLVTASLEARLAQVHDRLIEQRRKLHDAEAPDRIALHVSRAIEAAIAAIPDKQRVEHGIRVARQLIETLERLIEGADVAPAELPVEAAHVLESLLQRRPDGTAAAVDLPLTPLLDTTLLTNAPGEPRVGRQIQGEIAESCGVIAAAPIGWAASWGPRVTSLQR